MKTSSPVQHAGLGHAQAVRVWPVRSAAHVAAAVCLSLLLATQPGSQAHANPPAPVAQPAGASASQCPALLRHTFPRLQDDKPQPLCQYAGKVLLVVNTASYCGFTPQYQGLEQLHAKYASRGLVVMGFPSNDFNQETGSAQQIAELCFNTYGVKFPMFAKTSVKGSDAHPFFRELARQAERAPRWNFHKYLVDRQGKVVDDFSSLTGPMDAKLVAALEKALAAR